MSNQLLKTTDFSQVDSELFTENKISALMSNFNIEETLHKVGISKRNGTSPTELLCLLLKLTANRKRSIYEALRYEDGENYKTMLNSFLNNPYNNWQELLYAVSKTFYNKFKHDVGECNVLIVDDTSKKKYGKMVENIAKFKDNSEGITYSGYQVPLCVLSNDRSATVVDFELKIGDKRCKNSKDGNYPIESHIYQRQENARKTKHSICIDMINRVLKRRFKFKYVLWDSWYNSTKSYNYVFDTLIPKGIHLVSRIKKDKRKYLYHKTEYTVDELFELSGEWEKMGETNTLTKSLDVQIIDTDSKTREPKGFVKLCFYKFADIENKKYNKAEIEDYIVLISTNVELSEEQVCKLYTKRWSIEVVIKDFKTYFGFYQSMSSKYAPQIADFTLKCIFYLLVCSLKERSPNKSLYQLLFEFVKELEKHNMYVLTRELFLTFLQKMSEQGYIEIKIDYPFLFELIEKFLYGEIYIDKIVEAEVRQYIEK